MALDGGVGVGVEASGKACTVAVVDDLDGPRRRRLGVVTQGDGLADEHGIDFVESAVQAQRAVFHDAAFGFEEEQVVEVCGRVGVAHVVPGERPLVEGGAGVEAAMGRLVVLALDPAPQAAVQRFEARSRLVVEAAEPGGAKGSEPPLDFPLSGWLIGPGMDERDAELGAHERELLGAEVGPVVDEQACGEASAGDGLFEHGQEGGGVF